MSNFDPIIAGLQKEPYATKRQLLAYLLNVVQHAKGKLTSEDKEALKTCVYREIEALLTAIPTAQTYKEKDILFDCEDSLLGLTMSLYPSADAIPSDKLETINSLVKLVESERYIETLIDKIFQQDTVSDAFIERLLSMVTETTDEYQKGKLYAGLIHYKDKLDKLDDSAKQRLTSYLEGELNRYMAMESLDEDVVNNLEIAADSAKHFPSDALADTLTDILNRKINRVSYFVVETLLTWNKTVPDAIIVDLANDLVHADGLYGLLKRFGMTDCFPKELATPEYLAKSDMVHWLVYPTELGKEPDAIEYVGPIRYLFKKEVYYVFKYRSDSDNLGEDRKNRWLIGWSSEDGGTFSNFDVYADFEKDTVKKTLKNIKKKLIG